MVRRIGRRLAFGIATLCLVGCAGDSSRDAAPRDSVVVDDTIGLEMPELPAAREGKVAGRTAARTYGYVVEGAWEGRAVRCDAKRTLHGIAQGEGFGAVVWMLAPDSGAATGFYEIEREFRGMPGAGRARVGVQLYPPDGTFAFRGLTGTVEVVEADSLLELKVEAWLLESVLRDTLVFASHFNRLPIEEGNAETCQVIGDEEDAEPNPLVR